MPVRRNPAFPPEFETTPGLFLSGFFPDREASQNLLLATIARLEKIVSSTCIEIE
jgi:hypothetical protein